MPTVATMKSRTITLSAALVLSILVGTSVAAFGVVAAGLTVAAVAAGWLAAKREWVGPALMFVAAVVPSGYPFELRFRLSLHYLDISITEALLVFALAVSAGAFMIGGETGKNRLTKRGRVAVGGLVVAMVMGLAIGLHYDNQLTDVARSIRPLLLYSAVLLPVLTTRDTQLRRTLCALVLAMVGIALLQLGSTFSPALRDLFLADRGRVWFGNGVLYALAIPVAFALSIISRTARASAFWGFCSFLMIAGLALSQTRSHWLATAISMAMLTALVATRKRRIRMGRMVAASAVIVPCAVLILWGLGATGWLVSDVSGLSERRNPWLRWGWTLRRRLEW